MRDGSASLVLSVQFSRYYNGMWFLLPITISTLSILYGIKHFISGPRCRSGQRCRIAVVGDSISAGGFPSYLNAALPDYEVTSYGVEGASTSSILNTLRTQVLPQGYDEIIIQGGLNDIARPNAEGYIMRNLEQMVQEVRSTGARVILLSLTPWSRYPRIIESINSKLFWRAPFLGVDRYVDVHSILNDGAGGLRQDLIGDQMLVHPNSAGHQLIGERIIQKAY